MKTEIIAKIDTKNIDSHKLSGSIYDSAEIDLYPYLKEAYERFYEDMSEKLDKRDQWITSIDEIKIKELFFSKLEIFLTLKTKITVKEVLEKIK